MNWLNLVCGCYRKVRWELEYYFVGFLVLVLGFCCCS